MYFVTFVYMCEHVYDRVRASVSGLLDPSCVVVLFH